jgi:PST family polysaccharide transporter
MIERVVRAASVAAAWLLVARLLGPGEFGIVSYATAAVALVLPASMALHPLLLRTFAVADSDIRCEFSAAFHLLNRLALLSFLVVSLFAVARLPNAPAVTATLIAGVGVFVAGPLVAVPFLIVRGRARIVSVTQSAASILAAVGLVWVATYVGAPSAIQAVATLTAGVTAGVLFLVSSGRALLATANRHAAHERRRRLTEQGWPLVVTGVAVAAYMSLDQLMLGLMTTDAQTGQYAVAVRIVTLTYLLPVAAMTAYSARIALRKSADHAAYEADLQRLASYLVAITAVTALVIAAAGYFGVVLILGPSYADVYPVTLILLPSTIFIALHVAQTPWIVNEGRMKYGMTVALVGAGVNTALNLILIPRFSIVGAAVASLLAYGLVGMGINAIYPAAHGYFRVQLRAFNPAMTWRLLGLNSARGWRR